MRSYHSALVVVLFFLCAFPASSADESCPALTVAPVTSGTNLFDDRQEVELGDAIAASLLQSNPVVQDAAITDPLQAIVARLAQPLPATNRPTFRVFVFESTSADAFSIPGRIYISRKLVALTHSEEEMAGVLAHEMGHMVAHHSAIGLSEQFRTVLGVTSVGDQADITTKWNEYLSNRRRQHVTRGDIIKANKVEERQQLQADTVAIYLLSRAGYSPQAFADIFDRIADTKGNTGGFWSGLFGTTTEDSKRLRELVKNRPAMPAACVDAPKELIANYASWRNSVLEYRATGHEGSLPGLISKHTFTERLRPEILNLRISSDGHSVLAQDDSNIFVLTRSPLKALFRIDATDASAAQFSPDSHTIVFQIAPMGSSPRVERWDVASQKRIGIHEIYVRNGCLSTALSPDGTALACLTYDEPAMRFDYDLFDTASGTTFWHKKGWYDLQGPANGYNLALLYQITWALAYGDASGLLDSLTRTSFSSDGHYFVAHSPQNVMAMDMTRRAEVGLSMGLRDLLRGRFTFLDNDRLMAYDTFKERSAVVRFPGGESILKDLPIGNLHFTRVSGGNYVLLGPLKDNTVGIFDLEQRKVRVNSKRTALDVFDDQFIAEGITGDLTAFDLATVKEIAKVELPDAPMGPVFSAAVSPGFNWLAISGKSRGAVWNLETGQRMYHTRAFRGGYFPNEASLLAVFPKFLETPRSVVQLSTEKLDMQSKRTIPEDEHSTEAAQYMLAMRPEKDISHGMDMDVRQLATDNALWTRHFAKGRPAYFVDPGNNSLVLYWPAGSSSLQELAKHDAEVAGKMNAYHDKGGIDYVQVLDLDSGKQRGAFAIDTGKHSIDIGDVTAASDTLALADKVNRVLVYSLDGTRKAIITGKYPQISPQAK